MGHGYKHRQVKAELIDWLWGYENDAFWERLESLAGKDWQGFANYIKGEWRRAGGYGDDLCFLDNKQHAVNVWQLLNAAKKPGQSKKDKHLQTKAELIDWLWYYENNQFWDELAANNSNGKKKAWRGFAAKIKSEWSKCGGDVRQLDFLDNSQHAMDVYNTLYKGKQPQLPRQPRALPR